MKNRLPRACLATAAALLALVLLAPLSARAESRDALLEWAVPPVFQTWAAYGHLVRTIDLDGAPDGKSTLRADLAAGGLEWSPLGWFSLGAFGGAARARVNEIMTECGNLEAGGGLNADATLWQITSEQHRAAWDTSFRLELRASYWRSGDDGQGELEWAEYYAALPVRYRLYRNRGLQGAGTSDFRSLAVWAGPAFSAIDGTWSRQHLLDRDFSETHNFGLAAGADLWLIDSLKVGGRMEWFDEVTFSLGLTYSF